MKKKLLRVRGVILQSHSYRPFFITPIDPSKFSNSSKTGMRDTEVVPASQDMKVNGCWPT